MANVLYCDDNPDLARVRGETLERIHGHQVVVCTTARESLEAVRYGASDLDVAIIHKDLGLGNEPIGSEQVIAEIHESAPHVRIGIVSGEFPHGRSHVVESLEADFYMPTRDSDWYIGQVERGPVSPQEMERRGRSVEMPR